MRMMIEQIFLQILNMSLMASYCIAAVFLLRWLFRKAPRRYSYMLWIVVAFRLVCPLSVESAFSIFNLKLMPEVTVEEFAEQKGDQSGEDMHGPGDVAVQPDNGDDDPIDQSGSQLHGQAGQAGVAEPELSNRPGEFGNGEQSGVVNQSGETNQGAHNDTSNQQGAGSSGIAGQPGNTNVGGVSADDGSGKDFWPMIGAWLWIGGMIALAVLMAISWIRLKLHVRTAVKVRGNIYETEGIESPFVMGSFRTKIYLPAGLTAEQQELILLHENCHIRRGDHLFKLLATLLTIVYWFNPMVWMAWFGFCRDMEMSCDEMALEGADSDLRKAYSQTLLAVASARRFSWQMPPAFGENDIKSRIMHVLNPRKPAVWVGGAFVVALIAVLVIFGTNGRNEVPDETLSGSEQSKESKSEETSESGKTEPESAGDGKEEPETDFSERAQETFDYNRTDIAAIHTVDIDHDGSDEDIIVFNVAKNGATEVFVVEESVVVWKASTSIAAYCTGLFLQEIDEEAYFVGYDSDPGYTYRYFQFSLMANEYKGIAGQQRRKEKLGEYDILTVNPERYDSFPLDVQRIGSYVDGVNTLLEQSEVLYLNKAWAAGENGVGTYREELNELFVPTTIYQDCGSLQEKLELLTETKMEQFLPDGRLPEMLANLSSTMPQRLAPYLDKIEDRYAKVDEYRADLFADYNGDKVQIVQKETASGEKSLVYYCRAKEGETTAQVAKRLVEIMYAAMSTQGIGAGAKVVTDFLITDQTLRTGNFNIESISEAIIQEYCANGKKLTLENDRELDFWVTAWLSLNYGNRELNPLPEDMWLFIPEGYYRFEGADLVSFEGAMSVDTQCVDGMIPFIYQGGGDAFEYLLLKQGNVYRLQKATEATEYAAEMDDDMHGGEDFVPETLSLVVPGLEYEEGDRIFGAYDADLDHDGVDEQIVLLYIPKEGTNHGTPQIELVVMNDGQEIYRGRRVWVKENGLSEAFMLYSRDDREYLIEYIIDDYASSGTEYSFAVYYLTENGEIVVEDNDRLWLDALISYSISAFPVKADTLAEYVDHVNQYFEDSIILCSSIGGGLSASNSEEKLYYTEDIQRFFDGKAEYDGCETIEAKVERLNQTLLHKWFTNGQIPEMPETFKNRIAELLDERKSEMSIFAEVMQIEDRSVWFEEYNGDKIQMTEDGVVFFRADEGETAQDAAKRMVETIYESYTEPSDSRTFTVTDYRIVEQKLHSWESMIEGVALDCWERYLRLSRGVIGDDLIAYAESWMTTQSFINQIPLEEDVWYFWPRGYYRYEGVAGIEGSFGYMDVWGIAELVDGMKPFYYQGGPGATEYLLMKMGDVYRMQKGYRWGE